MHGAETPEERMFRRQALRGSLARTYWDLLGARPGWRIADVGAGPGYFTLRYAALTGPTGHVHAVDVSEEALAWLRGQLDPAHHAHVTTETLDVARHPLPALGFDALVCTDMLHHVADVGGVLRNLRATPARLLVAEFHPDGPGAYGPPREERIAPAQLAAALEAAGWAPRPSVALDHEHYAIVSDPVSPTSA